jgi:hypothetical protein
MSAALVPGRSTREGAQETALVLDERELLLGPGEASRCGRACASPQIPPGERALWLKVPERLFDGASTGALDVGVVLLRDQPPVQRSSLPDEAPLPPAATTPKEKIVLLRIELDHRYHDDEPVHGAAFKVQLADGTVREGTLDNSGHAVIEDVPDGPASVQVGPDARPYALIDQDKSPTYKSTLTSTDIDALIEQARASA